MEKELWLARDDDGWYRFYKKEPTKQREVYESDNPASEIIAEKSFRSIFGCHPVCKGRKKKIERILIELED